MPIAAAISVVMTVSNDNDYRYYNDNNNEKGDNDENEDYVEGQLNNNKTYSNYQAIRVKLRF